MSEIIQFKSKDDLITEKCEWMLDHEDEVDWGEFCNEMLGFSSGTKYRDIIDSLPSPEEIEEMAKEDSEYSRKRLKEVMERSKELGPRIIKEPETMEEAVNMSDEDYYEYLKQEEIRERLKNKYAEGGRS